MVNRNLQILSVTQWHVFHMSCGAMQDMFPFHETTWQLSFTSFWVSCNISLTWMKAIWGWFTLLTIVLVRSHWGRYNLPRSLQHHETPHFHHDLSRSFFQCLVGCFQCRSTYLLLDGPLTMRILGNEHWDIVGQTYAYIGYIGYPIYRINICGI